MKKIITLILALTMCCAAFTSCADNKKKPDESGKQTEASTSSETKKPQAETTKPQEETKPIEDKAAFEGTISEILGRIIEKAKELDTDKEYGIATIECSDMPVDEDSCTDILGLSTEDFKGKIESALESKPNDSWFAHSVVLIKVKDGADTAKIADEIIKNTSPSRFGCLKAETILGGYAGQYIVFAATAASSSEAVYNAFTALSGVAPVKIERTNDWSGGDFFG